MYKRGEVKYLLINVIAKRARDLNAGSKAQVEVDYPADPIHIAVKEMQEHKLKAVPKKHATKMVDVIGRSS